MNGNLLFIVHGSGHCPRVTGCRADCSGWPSESAGTAIAASATQQEAVPRHASGSRLAPSDGGGRTDGGSAAGDGFAGTGWRTDDKRERRRRGDEGCPRLQGEISVSGLI